MIQESEEKKGKKLRRPKPSHRIGKKIGAWVTEKPWLIIATTVIVLGGLAAFVPKMQFTYGLLDSFPEDMPSLVGFSIIEEIYSTGEFALVIIFYDSEGDE